MTRLAAVMLGLALCGAASAQQDKSSIPPTIRVQNCTEGGCHAPIIDFKQLHGPAAVGACDVCHLYVSAEKHTFKLKSQGTDLCAFCHIDKVLPDGPVVHDPFGKGECVKCHNPHGGETHTLMKTKVVGDLCITCHTDVLHGPFSHEPAGEGRCNECHRAHSADEPKLLTMPPQKLCLSCHDDVSKKLATEKDVHQPAAEDCMQCHTAHVSEFADNLTMDPKALCVSCHEAEEQQALKAMHKHSAVFEDRACLNCHQPHASPHDRLIVDDGVGACLDCHNKPIKVSETHIVKSVAEVRTEHFNLHGPIKDQTCTGCHIPHGAELPNLLKAPYVDAFYQPFSVDSYALCFMCHNKQMVLDEETSTMTMFRDGARNLHYVHVTKPDNGRTCIACHNNHAAKAPSLIVDSVPYGQWRIPLNFKQTETGGSCASGCHNAKSYDRGPGPATRPALLTPEKAPVQISHPPAAKPEEPETPDSPLPKVDGAGN